MSLLLDVPLWSYEHWFGSQVWEAGAAVAPHVSELSFPRFHLPFLPL